jgi:predicted phage terminase large subunit-like protein
VRSRQASIDVEQIRRKGFYEFVKRAWHVVETMTYVDNWHIEEKCIHVEAVVRRQIRDLLINEPPGCSKSLIVSVLLPTWSWLPEVRPELRWIYGSFDPGLALRDAEKQWKLLTSPWFIERWGNLLPSSTAKVAMGDYENKFGGFRFSTSVGGKGTGRHCHIRVADDPIKPADVENTKKAIGAALEKSNSWWRSTMGSRMADPSDFGSIVCMQRLHESDLSAECKRDGYVHLCLPMRFVSNQKCVTPLGGDRRTKEGELLNPARFPEKAVQEEEKRMGGKDGPVASAQLQQSPAPPGGLIFKEETFQYFFPKEAPFVESFSCITVDCAFKDAEANSGVGIEVWGMTGAKFYCYHSVVESLSFSATIEAIRAVLAMYPTVNAILVEDKANGSAVIEILQKEFPQVVPMNPKTSKIARAHAANVYYQARSVFHLADAEWLGRKETNLKHFPKGRRADDVDCTSQALVWLAAQSMADFSAAMQGVQQEQKDGTWDSQLARHFSIG